MALGKKWDIDNIQNFPHIVPFKKKVTMNVNENSLKETCRLLGLSIKKDDKNKRFVITKKDK
jgi:hypothetical protein